jgi:hypothetical protein
VPSIDTVGRDALPDIPVSPLRHARNTCDWSRPAAPCQCRRCHQRGGPEEVPLAEVCVAEVRLAEIRADVGVLTTPPVSADCGALGRSHDPATEAIYEVGTLASVLQLLKKLKECSRHARSGAECADCA